ncbi:MAG: hypothetical protein U0470_12540 [Anaerolineae bacterium]
MGLTGPIHATMIRDAARRHLQPLGLVQKGRSRTWLDDHGWWIGVVEFQPSGWSRGTYLNVACMWMWNVKEYISFDEGGRIDGFRGYRDPDQFQPVADAYAAKAAQAVDRYRRLFPNVPAVCRYYRRNPPIGAWPRFNAAVACALAGHGDVARNFFRLAMAGGDDDRDWVREFDADAAHLSTIAGDVEQFRSVVVERVRRTREMQRLSPVDEIEFQ